MKPYVLQLNDQLFEPPKGSVICKLPASDYGEEIEVDQTMHHSVTHGEIVAVHKGDLGPSDEEIESRMGHMAYWHKYKDDAAMDSDRHYAFIEIKDILGFSHAATESN